MKKKFFCLTVISLLLAGCPVGAALGTDGTSAISEIKLTSASVPYGMKIAKELWASAPQLLRVRRRIGFPIDALLNQTLIYGNEQAQVNYMLAPNEKWIDFGYSKLVAMDGHKSFVLLKDNVILQVAATTKELEDMVACLFKADPIHYHKIRTERLPEDWALVNERYLALEEVVKLEQRLDGQVKNALEQEFIANRLKIKVRYYNCGAQKTAEKVAHRIADEKDLLIKRLSESSGPVVVVAESQDEKLNAHAMSLVNWRPSTGAEIGPEWRE